MTQVRSWDFTLNNYEEKDIEWLKGLQVKAMTVSKEVGAEGTKHLQGRIIFLRSYRLPALKKLHSKIHWEPTKAAADDNYMRKQDSEIIIDFNKGEQGKRTDLNKIKDEINGGVSVESIRQENPMVYHQYGRTLDKLEDDAKKKQFRTEMTKGIWYWGETGVGKSHKAFENYSEETHYLWPNDNGWWDGYQGQETVIINDFRGEIPYNMLLQLIDKWPMSVRRRNRMPIPFTSKNVIITSSLSPKKIYHNRDDEDSIEQLLRRLTVVELKKQKTLI